ncbi:hypothetical protein BJ170DRAFT_425240 [Xylariales sp. AK1849]|nr:hypothetical protein BJ170DRAFT_425240 [Xylariales sp. AK1849]
MPPKSILVTSATGNQGQGVVKHCLASSHTVYALVRDPSSTKSQSLKSAGATLVQGDLDDAASISAAIQQTNVEAFFLNLPPSPGDVQLTRARNAVEAAKSHPSIETFISSSVVGTGSHDSFPNFGPQHIVYEYWLTKHAVENLVRDASFPSLTIVRLPFFLQLFVPPFANVMFPELWSPDGGRILRSALKPETRVDLVDGGDIGAVAAAVLDKPDDFRGRVIDLAVEALTIEELAGKISKAKGVEVKGMYEPAEKLAERLGPAGPRLVAAQALFNDLGSSIDCKKNREEFKLTGVEEFFAKASV